MGRVAGVFSRILNNRHAIERSVARRKPRDRALWIGIDDSRMAALKMPMYSKAACERTLAAAALHGSYGDDRAHSHPAPAATATNHPNRCYRFLGELPTI